MSVSTEERSGVAGPIDSYFEITKRGSTIGREIRGGLTTFFTMAYIVVLNPLIIGTVADGTGKYLGGGDVPDTALVAAATALVAGLLSILMGVWARFPLAMAAGLGINAFLAYGIASREGMTWPEAMGFVVIEGVIITVLVMSGFRKAVFAAVPAFLKQAIAVGIGLFLAFIGLFDAGIVRTGAGTPTQFGDGGYISTWPMVVFVVGLFTAIVLMVKKVRGALLISIVVATVLAVILESVLSLGSSVENPAGWALVVPAIPDTFVSAPDFSLIGQVDLFGGFTTLPVLTALLLVFSLLITDFFDTMGTMTAVGAEAELNDENGNPPRAQEVLLVDSVGAVAGGLGSVSSNTSYIESAAGVGDGARTGLASVVTGIAFLLSTFLTPLYALVPFEAATPVLVVVGFLMVAQVAGIDWKDYRIAIPAFLTFIIMPFGYSISAGIGVGFISYVLLQVVTGGSRKVHPLMWGTAAAFVLYFAMGPIMNAIG
ncbi:NCS2 family permease [Demequina mangrovi]|uniref:Putative MFS transporter, AGZA family, xanthine/uracil permease n=1 Tax=Demequina mangrovi TaxID=1043493 RepID=A0A1H6WCZ5_9MICO|nr:NCS2 family permease [Demequina mangrovi]SEJ14899.1 putative MFS transporter, AGZA family, xanthine/uracil permease [Demequina mangrovi]